MIFEFSKIASARSDSECSDWEKALDADILRAVGGRWFTAAAVISWLHFELERQRRLMLAAAAASVYLVLSLRRRHLSLIIP